MKFDVGRFEIRTPSAVDIMAILVIIVMSIVSVSLWETNKNHEIVIQQWSDNYDLWMKEKEELQGGMIVYKDSYEELIAKAWHNSDDLIAYIDSEYTHVPQEVAKAIADAIASTLEKHKMDFSLVVGMIEVESRFNPMARSKKGAVGLMQIMPNIWGKELCVATEKEFYDISTNIECGVKVFLHNLERSNGDIGEALWRYNGTGGKKGEFAGLVYKAVGKFETFRAIKNGEYESDQQEPTEVTVSLD